MNIEINQSNKPFETQEGWHILTVAESGFSMLSGYAGEYGIAHDNSTSDIVLVQ